jgi:hypothetical protein
MKGESPHRLPSGDLLAELVQLRHHGFVCEFLHSDPAIPDSLKQFSEPTSPEPIDSGGYVSGNQSASGA